MQEEGGHGNRKGFNADGVEEAHSQHRLNVEERIRNLKVLSEGDRGVSVGLQFALD